jgi:hypothetical protein
MYKIAGLNVKMECSGETLLTQGEPYRTAAAGQPDMIIDISDEALVKIKESYPQFCFDEWEYIHKGFAFSYKLLEHSGFCLHASAVAMGNKAVLFSAPCGTGKSTHAGLWQQYFGKDRAVIINDDRPALRLLGDKICVYGTPWSGKTNLNANIKVPLQAVVFLKQAGENHIERLTNKEAIKRLIRHSIRPNHDKGKMDALLTLLDTLLQKTPVYHLDCNISMDAVKLAYDTINKRMRCII